MGNAAAAAQVASLLLALVLALVLLERLARRRQRFYMAGAGQHPQSGFILSLPRQVGAVAACALPVLLGFAVPGWTLLTYALDAWRETLQGPFLASLRNSVTVAVITALLVVAVGTLLAYAARLSRAPWVAGVTRVASLGYAVPGTVLAVGVMIPAAALDRALDAFLRDAVGLSSGLLLSGTLAALVFACVTRFLVLGFGTLDAGLARVTPSMDHAARSLGAGPWSVLWRVHVPLLRGSAMTAALLVFVDAMKELPMTLLLRPFNFPTLATHVYEYASAERFRLAAPAALAIVAAGLYPVILLSSAITRMSGVGESVEGEAPRRA
jgi:iron(III) transport system permease protein